MKTTDLAGVFVIEKLKNKLANETRDYTVRLRMAH